MIWGSLFARRWKKVSALLTRRYLMGGILVIPLLFSSAVILIALATFRVDFNQAVAVIMAFAINASADFMLFPIDRFITSFATFQDRNSAVEEAMEKTGSVVLKDAAINALLFVPLMFARFEPIQQLGLIMVVMLAATAFAVRVIIPCLLVFSAKKA